MSSVTEEKCLKYDMQPDSSGCYNCPCIGADLNRNFDAGWEITGESNIITGVIFEAEMRFEPFSVDYIRGDYVLSFTAEFRILEIFVY